MYEKKYIIKKPLEVVKAFFEVFFTLFLCLNILIAVTPAASLRIFMNTRLLPVLMQTPRGFRFFLTLQNLVTYQLAIVFIVLSGLALIYLLNIDVINSKIKHFFQKGISLSVIQTNEDHKTFIPPQVNGFLVCFSCFLFVLFFFNIFNQTVIIHPETYDTFARQFHPGAVFSELIPTIFNKVNFEGLGYRPRVMSFLIDYININALPLLNRIFPFWGMRLVFNVIAVPLSIFSVYLLLNHFFKTMPLGIKLFLSVLPLFSGSFQWEIGNFYRTSKFLVVPLCLFLLYYFLKKSHVSLSDGRFEKKDIPKLLAAVFLVSLCTIYDEYLVAVVVYFSFAAILLSVIKRQLYSNAVVFTSAGVFYLFWYLVIGRFLFGMFTGVHVYYDYVPIFVPMEMGEHIHTYSVLVTRLSLRILFDLVRIYLQLISYNMVFLSLIIIVVFAFFIIRGKKQYTYDILNIPVFIITLSFLLTCAVTLGHAGIIRRNMSYTYYMAPSFFLLYAGAIYLFYHFLSGNSNRILTSFVFLCFSILVFSNNNTAMRSINAAANRGSSVFGVLPGARVVPHGDPRIIELDRLIEEHNIRRNFVYFVCRQELARAAQVPHVLPDEPDEEDELFDLYYP